MSGETLDITDSEFKQLAGKSGLVYFSSLDAIVNLNSVSVVASGGMVAKNRIKLHDGGYAIKKHGSWVSEENPSVKLDMNYYAYLAKDMDYDDYQKRKEEIKQIDQPSDFAKQLAKNL